ncbi:EpsG family protein [Luteimonas sp. FXH3W]|uniref:EpsG family protein n=1 Tax=Aquilutibacter rugosus TaxID=3115820 RepID=A0ABU7UW24_9GAMM
MLEYFFVCLLVLACSVAQSASRRGSVRVFCVASSFLVLLLFLGPRYSYGNDYWSYFDVYHDSYRLLSSPYNQIEKGWLWLNILMQPFGYRGLIIGTSVVYLAAIFFFILREAPQRYVWLSFFLLLVEPSNFLVHLSAMRQAFAIMIFVVAVQFLASKKLVLFLLCVFLASLFHRSALAMLPLAIIALPELNNRLSRLLSGRRWIYVYLALYLIFAWLISKYGAHWVDSLQAEVDRYRGYTESGTIGTGLGVLAQAGFFVLFMYYGLRHRGRERILLFVCATTYLVVPLTFVNALAARLMMYPQITMLVALPLILTHEKRKHIRWGIGAVFIAWTLLASYRFWTSEVYAPNFKMYESVLSN